MGLAHLPRSAIFQVGWVRRRDSDMILSVNCSRVTWRDRGMLPVLYRLPAEKYLSSFPSFPVYGAGAGMAGRWGRTAGLGLSWTMGPRTKSHGSPWAFYPPSENCEQWASFFVASTSMWSRNLAEIRIR